MENKFKNTIVPKTAVFELTYKCNHKCIFCSTPWESPKNDYGKIEELSIDQWKDCLDTVVNHGVVSLAFSGGEPLLKEGLPELIEYAKAREIKEPVFSKEGEIIGHKPGNLKLSLITNGKLVDANWIKLFKENEVDLVVSLPGRKTFGYHTGGGDFDLILSNISKLSKAGVKVVIGVCVTKKNINELFETIAYGFLNGAKQLLLNRFLPGGRGLLYEELCLNSDEVVKMFDMAEEACTAANLFGSVGTEVPKCLIKKEYKMLKVGSMCSGGIEFFVIDPSGRVRPCNHSPVNLGYYKDIISAIKTDYWQVFKERRFLPEECSGCMQSIECDCGCREAAHIVSGDICALDPVFEGGMPPFSFKTLPLQA